MIRLVVYFLTVLGILVVGGFTIYLGCAFVGVPISASELIPYIGTMAVLGIGGSLISLFASKYSVKRSMRVQVISYPQNEAEKWLVETVAQLAKKKDVDMPEVGIYPSRTMNAFATGWNRNSALVAVSTGLLEKMNKRQVEAVLGHEMSHVSNGDMVTMTLIQGVVNTFVMVISSVLATVIAAAMSNNNGRRGSSSAISGPVYIVCQLLFGFLGAMVVSWFSRWREYRADAGSAEAVGAEGMISALSALGGETKPSEGEMNSSKTVQALCISSFNLGGLFATHPSLEDRIAALQKLK
ncbi:MAG: protease HtpX [Ruminobacter sp.]|nr:protease HtpX [Ruminobacter sp.]